MNFLQACVKKVLREMVYLKKDQLFLYASFGVILLKTVNKRTYAEWLTSRSYSVSSAVQDMVVQYVRLIEFVLVYFSTCCSQVLTCIDLT